MSDLISRDALFAEFENAGWYDLADRDEIAEELLLHAPTVDAIPVRCEKCKFSEQFFGPDDIYCPIMDCYPNNDFYCGAGERKDGEK